MIDERMVLINLIKRDASEDLVQQMLRFAKERMAETETDLRAGIAFDDRDPVRTTRRGVYRTQSAKAPFAPPIYGLGTLIKEDQAACSFPLDVVKHLIRAAGIEPCSELVLEEIARRLREAVRDFIMLWRQNTSAPPAKMAAWAREVERRARALLEILHVDPDDTLPAHMDLDVFTALVRPDRESCFIVEDERAVEICEAMATRIRGLLSNDKIRNFTEELLKHPEVFNPPPHVAIELGFQGTAYIANSAAACATHFDTIKGRKREALTALDGFVAALNTLYSDIFGREGTVTVDPFEPGHPRKGPVIGFTQAVMKHVADRLPAEPALRGDARMREALQNLADSSSKVAARIRKIRSLS